MTNETQTDRLAEVLDCDREAERLIVERYPYIMGRPGEKGKIAAAHRITATQSLSTDLANAEARVKELEEALKKIASDFEDFPLPEHAERLGDGAWHSMAVEQQSIARAALNPGKESA